MEKEQRQKQGELIKLLRLKRGMSQAQLGVRLGVDRHTIDNAERRGCNDLTLAFKLARVFKIKINLLDPSNQPINNDTN